MRTVLVAVSIFMFVGVLGGTLGGLAGHETIAGGGPVWVGFLVSFCIGAAIGLLLGAPLFESSMDATEDWRHR